MCDRSVADEPSEVQRTNTIENHYPVGLHNKRTKTLYLINLN